jgi:hypothetical protein
MGGARRILGERPGVEHRTVLTLDLPNVVVGGFLASFGRATGVGHREERYPRARTEPQPAGPPTLEKFAICGKFC